MRARRPGAPWAETFGLSPWRKVSEHACALVVVPHNLYLTMFSPSSVNVMPFDPQRGSDHARAYATKYASKPETVDGPMIPTPSFPRKHATYFYTSQEVVRPRSYEKWLEGLAQESHSGFVHGLQPHPEFSRRSVYAAVPVHARLLHWQEGVP